MDSAISSTPCAFSRATEGVRVATLVRALSIFFLTSLVLDGPLRFALAASGLIPLIYLPKALLLLALPLLVVTRLRIKTSFLRCASVTLLTTIWGALQLNSLLQVVFGVWVLVPFLYGLLVSRFIVNEPENYRGVFAGLFLIATAGVLLNPLFAYPWVGASLDVGGTSIEISRQWSSSGVDRYAGFSRASFTAASELLAFAIWLVVTAPARKVNLAIWLVAGGAIALTTSKGPVAAWLVLSIFFLSGKLLRNRVGWRRAWTGVLFVVVWMVVTLPLSTLLIHYDLKLDSVTDVFLFASFGDRLVRMWPGSFGLLHGVPEWLLGRGLGGIGSAQAVFESQAYLPGDNIFVYVTVAAGLPIACIFLFGLAVKVSRLFRASRGSLLVFCLFLFVAIYGLVVNVMEDPLLAFLLGIIATASTGAKRIQCA